jgi:hypothetical protein
MSAIQLEPLAVPFQDALIQVAGVRWSADAKTVVEVRSGESGRKCKVQFEADEGVRILDEINLASFWIETPADVLKSTWLFEVRAGGWFDLERTRQDFYMQHEAPITEYLIASLQFCVSILARRPPVFVEGEAPDA